MALELLVYLRLVRQLAALMAPAGPEPRAALRPLASLLAGGAYPCGQQPTLPRERLVLLVAAAGEQVQLLAALYHCLA